jgi:hypothetical protein
MELYMIETIFGVIYLAVIAGIPAADENNNHSVSPNLLRNGNFSFYQGENKPADWKGDI